MTLPDNFFKVNPRVGPGSTPLEEGESALRAQKIPPADGKFKKALTGDVQEGSGGAQSTSETAEESGPLTLPKTDKRVFEELVNKAKSAPLDPTSNQTPALAKETKVAPSLGKEQPTAPSEEPWAKPYVENAEKPPELEIKVPEKAVAEGEVVKSEKPESVALPDLAQKPLPSQVNVTNAPKVIINKPLPQNIEGAVPPQAEIAEQALPLGKTGETQPVFKKKEERKVQDPQNAPQTAFGALPGFQTAVNHVTEGLGRAEAASPRGQELVDLVNQIVDKMSTVSRADTQEVHMTIKNIPLFEGATVKVTTYRQAPKEFNVEFSNLTQQAKEILDNPANRILLHDQLEQKGYVVQMITTTTYLEAPLGSQASGGNSRDREGSGGGSGGGSKGRDQGREKKEEEK